MSPLLDITIGRLKPEQEQILIQKITSASINTRNWVFTRVQETVDTYWIMSERERTLTESDVKARRELFKQLIVPFQALVQAAEVDSGRDPDRYLHRYLAHIAFCQEQIATAYARTGSTDEALMNWRLAQDNLTKAVQVRNRDDIQPETGRYSQTASTQIDRDDTKDLFWHYELHQVLCSYKMSDIQQAEVTLDELKPFWSRKSVLLPSLFKSLDFEFLGWLKSHPQLKGIQGIQSPLNDILATEAVELDFDTAHFPRNQGDPDEARSPTAVGLNGKENGQPQNRPHFDDGHG